MLSLLLGSVVIVPLPACSDSSPRNGDAGAPVRLAHPAWGAPVPAGGWDYVSGTVPRRVDQLLIQGRPARLDRGGGFLAYVPTPRYPDSAYRILAIRGEDTLRAKHPISFATYLARGSLLVDSTTLYPKHEVSLRPTDRIRVGITAPAEATVWLEGSGGTIPMHPPAPAAASRTRPWGIPVTARQLSAVERLVVAHGPDTVRLALPPVDTAPTEWPARLVNPANWADNGDDGEIVGRSEPGGPYSWFFLAGTPATVTGRYGEQLRVRLAPAVEAWVHEARVRRAEAAAEPASPAALRLVLRPEWAELSIPMTSPPAYQVAEGQTGLALDLFGASDRWEPLTLRASRSSWLRQAACRPASPGRVRCVVSLNVPLFGYDVHWREGTFVLRVRRPPVPLPEKPLQGLRIALDAGHPPAGAVGPTGLSEREVTLAVARQAKRMLEKRGATVVMTRTDRRAVGLEQRRALAARHEVHAFVSIHVDGVPSGGDPDRYGGTSTYYFHRHSVPLASALQWSLSTRLELRDRGVRYGNYAVIRPTWFPAALVEGTTLSLPAHERALRSRSFRAAYARGIVDGLERYFAALSRHTTAGRAAPPARR